MKFFLKTLQVRSLWGEPCLAEDPSLQALHVQAWVLCGEPHAAEGPGLQLPFWNLFGQHCPAEDPAHQALHVQHWFGQLLLAALKGLLQLIGILKRDLWWTPVCDPVALLLGGW